MKTFVIGDVHGRLENLVALLTKAGLLNPDGTRTLLFPQTRVIQLGDLGDFRKSTVEADMSCYQFAFDNRIEVLWGNHDYATQNRDHAFQGYADPHWLTLNLIRDVMPQFSTMSHGFLLTHAGLHPTYMPAFATPDLFSAALNSIHPGERAPVIDDIGYHRSGPSPTGGILWRDDREDLLDVPQIFGHTRGLVRSYGNKRFCIDVGARKSGNLAGMWLPDMRVVSVGEDADVNEMALNGDLE